MAARILLVDDDAGVLSSLRRALALEGYYVVAADDGETALRLVESDSPDLVVLDVMLPGISGLDVCRRLRAFSLVPILLLTARDTVPDLVAGLDMGADDYLVKPFALDELLARVRALLRRVRRQNDEILAYADLRLDLGTREVFRADCQVALSTQQFGLLEVFLRHPRQALTRSRLCEAVWGSAFEGESNFVDVAVMDLRKRLEAGGKTRLIQTVRGVGYALRED